MLHEVIRLRAFHGGQRRRLLSARTCKFPVARVFLLDAFDECGEPVRSFQKLALFLRKDTD